MMLLLPSWLCSSDEFTEHVNTVPLSELFTDWNIRTDNSSWAVWTSLFHETASVAIPGTSHVIFTALPTVRSLKDPVITISTVQEELY